MTASYPNSIKSFTTKTDDVDYVMAEHVNSLQDEVTAIETELGSGTSGAYATVRQRFEALETNPTFVGTVTAEDIVAKDDLTVSGTSQFIGNIDAISALFLGDVTVSGSLMSVPYQDYSGSSTVVGWGTLTAKKIEFMKLGKIVLLSWNINGTSNSVDTSFTVPYRSIINFGQPCKCIDNGAPTTGYVSATQNSSTFAAHATYVFGSDWVTSGTKQITGQCWYLTDM